MKTKNGVKENQLLSDDVNSLLDKLTTEELPSTITVKELKVFVANLSKVIRKALTKTAIGKNGKKLKKATANKRNITALERLIDTELRDLCEGYFTLHLSDETATDDYRDQFQESLEALSDNWSLFEKIQQILLMKFHSELSPKREQFRLKFRMPHIYCSADNLTGEIPLYKFKLDFESFYFQDELFKK